MAKIELTPDKLANIKQKAEAAENCSPSPWVFREMPAVKGEVLDSENFQVAGWFTLRWQAEHIAAADPATVLAMVEEIERLQDQNYHLRLKSFLEALDGKQESEAEHGK